MNFLAQRYFTQAEIPSPKKGEFWRFMDHQAVSELLTNAVFIHNIRKKDVQ